MKTNLKFLFIFITVTAVLVHPMSFAADTSIATINISGNVPTVFTVTVRGMPGDLDLTSNVTVVNRRIGLLHFRYNANVSAITISSSTASGGPEGPSGPYGFQGGFNVSVAAGCTSVDAAYNGPFKLTTGGTDIKSALSTALTEGVEEDCDVLGSWKGTNKKVPLAGSYSLNILVTMTSQ